DDRKIDFLRDEKLALYTEMLHELRESGVPAEKLLPYEQKVSALFGIEL
ncbi:MAG TPA: ComE operon protein 2, partial [Lysinibacillus sp.]|nr:ComE operon protein 2 [Lysinibacillus sp.]